MNRTRHAAPTRLRRVGDFTARELGWCIGFFGELRKNFDPAAAGHATRPDPLGAARMREFVYLCDEGFSAIVKLTMVKYILPKLRN